MYFDHIHSSPTTLSKYTGLFPYPLNFVSSFVFESFDCDYKGSKLLL